MNEIAWFDDFDVWQKLIAGSTGRFAVRTISRVLLLLLMFMLCGDACAGCLPKSTSVPPQQIRGDILCEDTSIPEDISVVWLEIDGTVCDSTNYEFVYPFTRDGYYQLNFWVDGSFDHEIAICAQGSCASNMSQAGFSITADTPGPCSTVIIFPAYRSIMAAPILIPLKTLGSDRGILFLLIFVLGVLIPMKLR